MTVRSALRAAHSGAPLGGSELDLAMPELYSRETAEEIVPAIMERQERWCDGAHTVQCSKRAGKRSSRSRTWAQPACATIAYDTARWSPSGGSQDPGVPRIRSDAACPHRRRRCAMPACKPPWAASPPARVRACLVRCCKPASGVQYCTWCCVQKRPQAVCSAMRATCRRARKRHAPLPRPCDACGRSR